MCMSTISACRAGDHRGLITGGRDINGKTNNALRGIQFVGPNATPGRVQFRPGVGTALGIRRPGTVLGVVRQSELGLQAGHGIRLYKAMNSAGLKASVQINYGRTDAKNASVPLPASATSRSGGTILIPATIQAQMDATGVNQLIMGTTNLNNVPMGSHYTLDEVSRIAGASRRHSSSAR